MHGTIGAMTRPDRDFSHDKATADALSDAPRRPDPLAGRMVRLSLAVAALMPHAQAAQAQLAANCSQFIRFDTVAVCATGGSLEITPKAGKFNEAGCLYALGSPKRGVCTFKSIPSTGDVQIKVTAKTVTLTGPAGLQVKSFDIKKVGGGPTFTLNNVKTTATPVTFGVGANAIALGGQALGTYTGDVMIVVTFTP